jgi:hypothetical protein
MKMYKLLLVIFCILSASCKNSGSSAVNTGQIGKYFSYSVWAEVTDQQYYDFAIKPVAPWSWSVEGVLPGMNEMFYPDTDKIVQDTQSLVDSLVAVINENSGNAFINVPHPRVKVIRKKIADEVNAFAAAVPQCLETSLFWRSIEDSKTNGINKKVIPAYQDIPTDGIFENLDLAEGDACIHRTLSQSETTQFAAWLNENYFNRLLTQCTLDPVPGKSALVSSSECKSIGSFELFLQGWEGISFPLQSDVITLMESILDFYSDKNELKAIIAHELVHYYYAHGVTEVGYFYDLKEDTEAGRPIMDLALDHLGRTVKLIVGAPLPREKFAGAQYYNHVRELGLSLVRNNVCDNGKSCSKDCSETLALLGEDKILEAESALIRCAQHVPILNDQDNLEMLKKKKQSIPRSSITMDLKVTYEYMNTCIGKFDVPDNFGKFLSSLNKAYSSPICDQATALKEATKKSLGYYTAEQEADDVALKIIKLSGLSHEVMVKALKKLAALDGDPNCKKWQAAQKGHAIPVLGDYSDPHHETCFRVQNLEREIERDSPKLRLN